MRRFVDIYPLKKQAVPFHQPCGVRRCPQQRPGIYLSPVNVGAEENDRRKAIIDSLVV